MTVSSVIQSESEVTSAHVPSVELYALNRKFALVSDILILADVQHNSDIPRWPCGSAGAGLHPRQQDPLPDPP